MTSIRPRFATRALLLHLATVALVVTLCTGVSVSYTHLTLPTTPYV